jgi:hypothetical protein
VERGTRTKESIVTTKYIPGSLSTTYQSLPPAERALIDKQVDEMFRQRTGITRKLDWNSAQDKPHARTWLIFRDLVVARHVLAKIEKKMADLTLQHEQMLKTLAEQYAGTLAASTPGLPGTMEESMTGTCFEVAHLVTLAFEGTELGGIWEVMVGLEAAEGLTLVMSGFLAPLANLLAGLYAIGEANEAGQRGAERNAFKWGFSATIAAMANGGSDWNPTLPQNTIWGHQQTRGRNNAIRMVKKMGSEFGLEFLKRYEGPDGKKKILSDLGGYD